MFTLTKFARHGRTQSRKALPAGVNSYSRSDLTGIKRELLRTVVNELAADRIAKVQCVTAWSAVGLVFELKCGG